MKKVKKMADGGMSGLGDMVGRAIADYSGDSKMPPYMPRPGIGGGGGGGSATEGLGTVNQGAQAIGSALGRASEAIGGGDGGGGPSRPLNPAYMKKGGKVTTTRMSTATRSKKCSNW
jgi:hypothetical protein